MANRPNDIRLLPRWTKYAAAVLLSGSVLLLGALLAGTVPRTGFLLLSLLAVMLSAYVGGFGPGVLATIFGGLGATYLFLPPIHSFHITARSDMIILGIFATGAFAATCFLDWVNEDVANTYSID